jgi:hypothetical protein
MHRQYDHADRVVPFADEARSLSPVHLGHRLIKDRDIRFQVTALPYSLEAICGDADDLHIAPRID